MADHGANLGLPNSRKMCCRYATQLVRGGIINSNKLWLKVRGDSRPITGKNDLLESKPGSWWLVRAKNLALFFLKMPFLIVQRST